VTTDPSPEVYVYASDDAGLAAEMMGKHHTDCLAVREDKHSEKIIGMITSRAILNFYSRQRQKEHRYESPARTRRILVQGRKILRTYKN
jgi:CBS domain-containing protein